MFRNLALAAAGALVSLAVAVPAASASPALHCNGQHVTVTESKTGVLTTTTPDLAHRYITLVNGRAYEVTSQSAISGTITLNTRQDLPKGPASLTFLEGSCPRV